MDRHFIRSAPTKDCLPAPVPLERSLLAPGERADLIIDFSGHAGQQIVLQNDSFQVMQFRVGQNKSSDTSSLPATLRPVPKTLESAAVKTTSSSH